MPRIRAAGARLFFLPPYSPDLNPIEQIFAKLKHLPRKASERTVQGASTPKTNVVVISLMQDTLQYQIIPP